MGWIVFYINAGTKNSAAVLSPPLTLFALLSAATFLLLLVLFWRHNQSAYKRRYSRWERSFFCQRCGTLTEHNQTTYKSVFPVGTLVPPPALWHLNGAGIGFPQRSQRLGM